MNISDAKKIDMVALLSKLGFEVHHYQPENVAWYFSPLRQENTPSFKVDMKNNTWQDFGQGEGGDVVNFIRAYKNVTTPDALNYLNANNFGYLPVAIFQNQDNVKEKEPLIKIIKEVPINNYDLVRYLALRCIPLELAMKYCTEVHYTCRNKKYFAIGFKNDLNGYELRSAYFKGKSCDAISTIPVPGSDKLNVFEGFFDFLSAMVHYKVTEPSNTTIIMNSTNKTAVGKNDKLFEIFKNFSKINLYLDNDDVSNSGQNAAEAIKLVHNNVVDRSSLYKDYKDFNEFIQKKPH
jgi:hypothetical protein